MMKRNIFTQPKMKEKTQSLLQELDLGKRQSRKESV